MNITEDLKNVSDAALGKLAAQFGDLPRPLLAAIGAGDVAVERLARLRDRLGELWDDERRDAETGRDESETRGGGAGDETGDSRLADATRRAQQVAEDVAHRLGDMVGDIPDKAQKLIADLPAKAQEVANSLSRENLKETVESYTRRVADVYRELADRGGARVHDAEEAEADKKAAGGKAADKKAADKKAADKGRAAGTSGRPDAPKAAPRQAAPRRAAAESAATKPSAKKPAAKKPAAKKPAAKKPTPKNEDSDR